jgi:hypothetical protein
MRNPPFTPAFFWLVEFRQKEKLKKKKKRRSDFGGFQLPEVRGNKMKQKLPHFFYTWFSLHVVKI